MAPTISIELAGNRGSKKLSQKAVPPMMGKTRKVSKRFSRGFVPDDRHAIETIADSNPCALKRKCIMPNGDTYEQYGVPIQVLSLSKLSSFQRKDLVLKLKHELEQVRTFQKEISGEKRLVTEISKSIVEPVSRNTKKSGGHMKKSVKKALPPTSGNPMLMKQCETLLNRLLGHTFGWVFKAPVDVVALKIPDYYNVIKHPMDLGTVKTKLTSGKYGDPRGFAADVRLTFSNALTYNPVGNNVHGMAETMSKFFEVRWKQIEKKVAVEVPLKPTVGMETETAVFVSPLKKRKILSIESDVKQVPIKMVMSDVEKHKLSAELESLLADLPESIIDFLKENSLKGDETSEDEIEIDIDALSDETLLTLRKLLDDYILDKQKNMVEAETCEIKLHNEAGLRNSSMQPSKANDLKEDDVDIGGHDLHVSSFRSLEIEKDSVVKKSTSSSSSSEDGSSSSDSDSGTSSGSDVDCAKASAIENNMKLALGSDKTDVPGEAEPENNSVNGESQVEQKSQSNPNSGEVDCRQEGESERQVSPVKLYRAALLRSRFADTILKAQEKTITKGGKQDPERLRLEKEELEKRRKSEKARLQAEAKAAEEARRKEELKAAAEAKRKRELAREAARLALQKMEKTVDIDENSQFLEDLEMLQVVPTEPLQSLIDETSPVHTLDPLGSFKFPGNSNPLEQLGLYMKDDDEDEEEVDAPVMIDDPEEGEID